MEKRKRQQTKYIKHNKCDTLKEIKDKQISITVYNYENRLIYLYLVCATYDQIPSE